MTASLPGSVPPASPWGQFTQDPRRPESAGLRASDRDREVVLTVLAEAYADGRLSRPEYDERADAATVSRTLGELPRLLADLVPERAAGASPARSDAVAADDLHARAVRRWRAQCRQALVQLLVPSVICWTIWLWSAFDDGSGFSPGFPWPVFVTLGVGAHLLRVLVNRQDLVEEERRRLEKQQRDALARKPSPGSSPG
jgi:hypothetical protein